MATQLSAVRALVPTFLPLRSPMVLIGESFETRMKSAPQRRNGATPTTGMPELFMRAMSFQP